MTAKLDFIKEYFFGTQHIGLSKDFPNYRLVAYFGFLKNKLEDKNQNLEHDLHTALHTNSSMDVVAFKENGAKRLADLYKEIEDGKNVSDNIQVLLDLLEGACYSYFDSSELKNMGIKITNPKYMYLIDDNHTIMLSTLKTML